MSRSLVRFLYPLLGLAILVAISTEPLTAQRQGRGEAGGGGQQQIQVPGPVKDFLGTTDDVVPPVPMTGVPAKAIN